MPSTFIKTSIKNALGKAGFSINRSDHGINIYRSSTGQRDILHSALISADKRSLETFQDTRSHHLVVDQAGLSVTPIMDHEQVYEHFAITLSGIEIPPVISNASGSLNWRWPEYLKNGVRTLVISNIDDSGETYSDSYLIDFREHNQRLFGSLYNTLITEPLMGIYMINFRDDHYFAQGWVYDPQYQPAEQYFLINGKSPTVSFTCSQPEWESHIGPVSSYFTMKGDKHFSFFEAELDVSSDLDRKIILEYQNPTSTEINRCESAYSEDDLPIPDGKIFKRVSGDENPFTFRYVGYSTFLKLQTLCKKYLAEDFDKTDRILDWGCGCGRVTRYFSKYSSDTEIHGVDIDRTGIDWLRENLDFGSFEHIQPNRKTPFPDEHFDFIFGISIFTHLTEEDHFFWLKELQRIIAKNGIVAVTTGSTVMRARMFNANIGDQVSDQLSGYTDQGHNAQIHGSTDDDEYYRNTYITREYIHRVWSEYFDILDVHSGLISCLQDMVIMRRKF